MKETTKKEKIEKALTVFQAEKIITSVQLANILESSERTARRRLKEWQTYRSYNKNGRYYVLPYIAKFDSSGIWKFKNVLFSRHGNLKDTLFHFIDNSDAGLSASELSDRLGLPAYSFLSHCNKDWHLPRKKYQGIYIYFSKNKEVFEKQTEIRNEIMPSTSSEELPSDRDSILILAAFIKHPDDTPEQLVRRVRRNGVKIGDESVRNLLSHHDLIEKTFGFRAVEALKSHIEKLGLSVRSKTLFPKKPTIHFTPVVFRKNKRCSCGVALNVWKTQEKVATTLEIGEFMAHETVLKCHSCGKKYYSEELRTLIPHRCKFGFDVMNYIGKALFLRQRTIAEVISELKDRNIKISSSEVSHLGQKFIVYLAIAHKESSVNIKKFMDQKGGYILHLDGMCEGGSPHLISVLDEISKFVLGNVKVPTENAKQIIPLLNEVKKMFGKPQAVVHDMGRAMLSSVAEVFQDVPAYICHFHFLRDIGKDLFSKEYAVIRNRLKKHGISTKLRYRLRQFKKDEKNLNFERITKLIEPHQFPCDGDVSFLKSVCYVLILWAIDGKNQGNGFGFPFDHPHLVFYQRLNIVNEKLETIKQLFIKANSRNLKPVHQLSTVLQPIIQDTDCKEILPLLLQKIQVFDKLRKTMRITLQDSDKGLNDTGQYVDIKTIEQGVKDFRNCLINKKIYNENEGYGKMIEQIDKYWEKLFAAPMIMDTPTGTFIIQPQRTNNILEHFFRDYRKNYRRRSGNNNMMKFLQTMLADTPLVKNLENSEYLKILLNGKINLEKRFAEIDVKIARDALKKAKQNDEKIPTNIKKIIKSEKEMKLFLNLF